MKNLKKLTICLFVLLVTLFVGSNVYASEDNVPEMVKDISVEAVESNDEYLFRVLLTVDTDVNYKTDGFGSVEGFISRNGYDGIDGSVMSLDTGFHVVTETDVIAPVGKLSEAVIIEGENVLEEADLLSRSDNKMEEAGSLKGKTLVRYFNITKSMLENETNESLYFVTKVASDDYVIKRVGYNIKNPENIMQISSATETLDPLYEKYKDVYDLAGIWVDEETGVLYMYIMSDTDEETYMVLQEAVVEDYEKLTDAEVKAKVDKQLAENKKVNMMVNETITSSILEKIKEKKYVATIIGGYTEDGDPLYSWVIDGSQLEKVDYSISQNIIIGDTEKKEEVNALLNGGNPLNIQFEYHGELPKGTKVSINVSDKYKDGEALGLYYYNEETKQLELVSDSIEVKDGYVTLALEHCSEYVLIDNPVVNVPKTFDNLMTILSVIAISVIGIIGSTLAFKKLN